MADPRDNSPLYPFERTFVVHLTRDAGQAPDLYSGKIEHLASGQAACFRDLGELNEILRSMTVPAAAVPSAADLGP